MAEGGAVSECRFGWNISQPFVPWCRFEAIFYHGSGTPFLTEWKVILDPILPHDLNHVSFRVKIQCLQPEGSEEVIAVGRIKAEIILRTAYTRLGEFELPGYDFSIENQHSLVRGFKLRNFPDTREVNLRINIELDFPNQAVVPLEGNELVFRNRDLTQLSTDLEGLRRIGGYTDLVLRSTDSDQAFPVHSFMLRARWNNFFTEHLNIEHEVQTGISQRLLTRILNYIYQGRSRQIPSVSVEKNELCEVIDRYRLHHLYKTFVKEDSSQERKTNQEGRIFSTDYLLDYTTDLPEYVWENDVNNPDYDFRLYICFQLTTRQYFYSLLSRSPRRHFVRLTLQMKEMELRTIHFETFHIGDFICEPNENKDSTEDGSPLVFSGRNRILMNFFASYYTNPDQRYSLYSFRFILALGSGARTLKFSGTSGLYSFQDNRKMLDVLSNHMSELMTRQDDHDFQVSCLGEDEREAHRLHKAIFAARVPFYWAVLDGVEKGSEIPDEAKCTLSSEAFSYVRQYIYTGKVDRIPDRLLDDIGQFANQGGIRCLETLVEKIRGNA